MKTTVLIAAVLLVSTATFSQTVLKSTESADVNATAGASLKTGAVSKTTTLAKQTSKQTVNYANEEKQTVKKDAKSDVKDITKTTEQKNQVSASSQTNASAGMSAKNNNSGKDASLNGQTSLQTKPAVTKVSTKTGTASKPVKVKPVFVKTNTHVAMASAIKIK